MQQAESATRNRASGRIEVFEYPAGPDAPAVAGMGWMGWRRRGHVRGLRCDRRAMAAGGAIEARLRAEFDRRLAEETRRSFEAGRERGRQEGRQAEHEAQAAARPRPSGSGRARPPN